MSPVRHFSNLLDRINFDWDTECWNWTMSKVCIGYGRVGYLGKLRLAHRLSKYLFGELTEEQFNNPKVVVRHDCDNPSCINPHHLQIGTQSDNISDRTRKGRSAKHLENRDKFGRFKTKSNKQLYTKKGV